MYESFYGWNFCVTFAQHLAKILILKGSTPDKADVLNFRLIYVTALFFIIHNMAFSQCDFSLLPDGSTCADAKYLCGYELDGYSSTLPDTNLNELPWTGLCKFNGSAENMVWYAFTPCDSTVTLLITPSNCRNDKGIQAGMYRRCCGSCGLVCSMDSIPAVIGATRPFTLTWNQFTPGRVAYLVIDGMAGDVCDYTIEVIEGVDTTPPVDVDPSQLDNGFVVGRNQLECNNSGDTISYSMVLPSCLMNYADACFPEKINILDSVCFVWKVQNLGTGSYRFVDNDSVGTDVKIIFNGTGSDQFRIQVDVNIHPYYGGGCARGACGRVEDLLVTFSPDEVVTQSLEICPGESIILCNTTINSDRIVECIDVTNACRTLRYDVRVKPLRYNDLGVIYRCQGDFFEFQGTRYFTSGTHSVQDDVECDLVHRFEVRSVVMNTTIVPGVRQLDCNNESIILNSAIISDFPGDVKYKWSLNSVTIGTGSSIVVQFPGRYIVRAYIDNSIVNCSSSDFVDITLNKEKPVCTFDSPTLNCRRKSAVIAYQSSALLTGEKWTTPLGNVVNSRNFPIDSLLASSGVSCRFQAKRADNGCEIDTLVSISSDFVKPLVSITGDGELNCIVQKVELGSQSNMPVDSVRWIRDGDFLVANVNQYDATSPGNYVCWMRASRNGCTNDSSKRINEDRVRPNVDLGDNQLWYCNTENITIQPLVDRGPLFSYSWNQRLGGEIAGSLLSPDVVITSPGQFYLRVQNSKNGCVNTDSLLIELNKDIPTDISAEIQDPLCFGDRNGEIRNIEITGGLQPYTIRLNGVDINLNQINNLSPGTYEIEVRDKYECTHTETFILLEPELLTLEPIDDITVSFNETSNLEVLTNYDESDILSITWKDMEGNVVGTGSTFYFDQLVSQTYEVEVVNLNGCLAKTRVRIIVDSQVKFIISNIIKPGAGFGNDKLVIRKNNIPADILSLEIYDRWGSKVFIHEPFSMGGAETKEIEWNSNLAGQDLQSGVYMLLIKYRDYFGNENLISSDITVLR